MILESQELQENTLILKTTLGHRGFEGEAAQAEGLNIAVFNTAPIESLIVSIMFPQSLRGLVVEGVDFKEFTLFPKPSSKSGWQLQTVNPRMQKLTFTCRSFFVGGFSKRRSRNDDLKPTYFDALGARSQGIYFAAMILHATSSTDPKP